MIPATLVQYFSAHAPEVPDWFEPDMDTTKPEYKFEGEGVVNYKEVEAWERDYKIERFFHWHNILCQ